MDIKVGTRTFLESEVNNSTKRTVSSHSQPSNLYPFISVPIPLQDLYQKMVEIDPKEPTDEENADKAITK